MMLPPASRFSTVYCRTTAALTIVVGSLALGHAALAGPSVALRQGTTSVVLSPQLLQAATALGVTLDDVGPATVDGGVAIFPFTGGVLDTASAGGEILHGGGLSLTAGSTTVTLTDFIIETTGTSAPRLTGLVTADGNFVGRAPLFALAIPDLFLPLAPNAQGKIVVRHVLVTLTAEAAAALNGTFSITAFTAGLPIGIAKVKVIGINAL